jgi:hypothetical protein
MAAYGSLASQKLGNARSDAIMAHMNSLCTINEPCHSLEQKSKSLFIHYLYVNYTRIELHKLFIN